MDGDWYREKIDVRINRVVVEIAQTLNPMEQQQPPQPRAPNAYCKYVKAKIAQLKAEGATGSLFKAAADAYKAEVEEVARALMDEPSVRLPPRGRLAAATAVAKKHVLEAYA